MPSQYKEARALFSDATPGDALFCPRTGCVAFDDDEERMARHILYRHTIYEWERPTMTVYEDSHESNEIDDKNDHNVYDDYQDYNDHNVHNDVEDDCSSGMIDYGTVLERHDPVLGYFEYANAQVFRPADNLSRRSKCSAIWTSPPRHDLSDACLDAVALPVRVPARTIFAHF